MSSLCGKHPKQKIYGVCCVPRKGSETYPTTVDRFREPYVQTSPILFCPAPPDHYSYYSWLCAGPWMALFRILACVSCTNAWYRLLPLENDNKKIYDKTPSGTCYSSSNPPSLYVRRMYCTAQDEKGIRIQTPGPPASTARPAARTPARPGAPSSPGSCPAARRAGSWCPGPRRAGVGRSSRASRTPS